MHEYQIPRNVSSKFEFFPGIGWQELAFIVVGGGVGALFYPVLFFIRARMIITLFAVVLFSAAGYGLVKPLPTGESFLGLLQLMKRWRLSQRLYLYTKKGV